MVRTVTAPQLHGFCNQRHACFLQSYRLEWYPLLHILFRISSADFWLKSSPPSDACPAFIRALSAFQVYLILRLYLPEYHETELD